MSVLRTLRRSSFGASAPLGLSAAYRHPRPLSSLAGSRFSVNEAMNPLRHPLVRKMLPVLWHICVVLAAVQYVMELRSISWSLLPALALCFEVGILLSLALFHYVVRADPGCVRSGVWGATGLLGGQSMVTFMSLEVFVKTLTKL